MLENKPFNFGENVRQLTVNSRLIEEVGAEVIAKRNELIIAEAEYIDAKAISRGMRLDTMPVTKAVQYIEMDTVTQKKKFLQLEHELKNLMEKRDIIWEVNANLKAQIRLSETELTQLRYTQS